VAKEVDSSCLEVEVVVVGHPFLVEGVGVVDHPFLVEVEVAVLH